MEERGLIRERGLLQERARIWEQTPTVAQAGFRLPLAWSRRLKPNRIAQDRQRQGAAGSDCPNSLSFVGSERNW